jgi:hypothetical protein
MMSLPMILCTIHGCIDHTYNLRMVEQIFIKFGMEVMLLEATQSLYFLIFYTR